MTPPSTLTATQHGVRLAVRVQPRAYRSQIGEILEGRLRVRIAAPPVDSAANNELIRFLAKVFSRPKSAISICHGDHSRHKTIEIEGVDLDQAWLVIQGQNERDGRDP